MSHKVIAVIIICVVLLLCAGTYLYRVIKSCKEDEETTYPDYEDYNDGI